MDDRQFKSQLIELRKTYDRDIMLARRHFQEQVNDFYREYQFSAERIRADFEAELSGIPLGMAEFINEYVACVRAGPFWSPLA